VNQNPYQAPSGSGAPWQPQQAMPGSASRAPFILAAVGAWLASAYWAGLTLLVGVGAAFGNASPAQIVLPCVLIVLYALRGFQLSKGNPYAARRILWLHAIGGFAAIVYMASGAGFIVALQAVKLLIHIFGGVTAFLAVRASGVSLTGRR
jgi:hypothetical protein